MEAASVGAATPPMIEPSTAPTSAIGGTTTRNSLPQSSRRDIRSRSSFGTGGTMFGRMTPSSSR